MSETTAALAPAEDTEWSDRFEAYLRRVIADQPGIRADLRSGRGRRPEDSLRLHRHVARFVPDTAVGSDRETAVYGIAALAATFRNIAATNKSFGASCAQLACADQFSTAGIEKRLVTACRAPDADSLLRHLPGIITLMANAGVPISWGRLARDISWWDRNRGRTTRTWLRDFIRNAEPHDETADQPAITEE